MCFVRRYSSLLITSFSNFIPLEAKELSPGINMVFAIDQWFYPHYEMDVLYTLLIDCQFLGMLYGVNRLDCRCAIPDHSRQNQMKKSSQFSIVAHLIEKIGPRLAKEIVLDARKLAIPFVIGFHPCLEGQGFQS